MSRLVSSCLLAAALAAPAAAQELPILDPLHTQLITQEISGDASYEHIRYLSTFPHREGGSDGLWGAAQYAARRAEEYGLSGVRVIKQPATTRPWNFTAADLWIVEPTPERLASTLASELHLVNNSRAADVTAPLVDVGSGSSAEIAAANVAGAIVLTHGSAQGVMTRAVCEAGAVGIVVFPAPTGAANGINGSAGMWRPAQLRRYAVSSSDSPTCAPTFGFTLSTRQGLALRERVAAAAEPMTLRAVVDAGFTSEAGDESWMVMTEAFIRGTDPGAMQDVVLTGHLQEEGTSANDDASGVANVLEIGRALNRLIVEGRIPRPRRNIRLWWVTEFSSQRRYFADHPGAADSIWVNVNQDMVGADQSIDVMRKQGVTRVPATRFHVLNDVTEEVVEYMVAGNTFELAQLQAGHPMYPKPHLMIYFHVNTDHGPFLEAPIGKAAVSFTNMPDRYIHSTDDDLWNVDQTQLGRNAASVALIAYAMASAADDDVDALAAVVAGRGVRRMGDNLRHALTWIAGHDDKAAAYAMAVDQLDYAAARERLAAASLAEVAEGGSDAAQALRAEIDRRAEQMRDEVDRAYRRVTGARPPRRGLTDVERELAGLTPRLVAGPAEFLTGRGQVAGVSGLHGLMAYEVSNAVDGSRTGLDIYRYVAAEAREAGTHYYGTVTADAVLQYLRNLADAELIALGE
jgi:hypothetical protein